MIRIRRYVATQVPADQVEITTRAVCMTVATLMADPTFTSELLVIRQLQDENQYLRTQYTILKQTLATLGVKQPRKRAPAKKKAAAAPRVKGGTAAQRRAFQEGFRGRN